MKLGISITVAALALLGIAVALAGWDRPPLRASQIGFRGVAMELVTNPRTAADKLDAVMAAIPEPQEPAEPGGDMAVDVYENIKVLKDLSQNEFDRLMLAITEWVAPEEQSCLYCHNEENLASDDVYTKVVARRMIEMTRHINSAWTKHVGETGVTCYTCHAGNPIPANVWSRDAEIPQARGVSADRKGQNIAAKSVGSTSLPYDPFSTYLNGKDEIRVIGPTALPTGSGTSIQQTEVTYGLMMHISEGLGVNCTHCHNSRSFFAWDQSTPARTPAWHGIRMVRDLNKDFMEPLQPVFPPEKLGPKGDVLKTNCATCHQGLPKPLNGVNMLKDYLALRGEKVTN